MTTEYHQMENNHHQKDWPFTHQKYSKSRILHGKDWPLKNLCWSLNRVTRNPVYWSNVTQILTVHTSKRQMSTMKKGQHYTDCPFTCQKWIKNKEKLARGNTVVPLNSWLIGSSWKASGIRQLNNSSKPICPKRPKVTIKYKI